MSQDATTMESLYNQQIQKLALLAQEVQVSKNEKLLEKNKEDALKADFNLAAAKNATTQLESALNDLKNVHSNKEVQLRNLEDNFKILTQQAESTKSPADTIGAHKAEIEIMKVKPGVLEESIKILELELELAGLVAEAVAAEKRVYDAKKTVEDVEDSLEQLKKDCADAKGRFNQEWPELVNRVKDTHETDNLAIELEAAKATILKQSLEIETLKTSNAAEEKTAGLPNGVEKKSSSSVSTEDAANIIKSLKEKIEQMEPLYRIGSIIRARKLEFDNRKSAPNWELVNAAGNSMHNGQSKADATMFLDFAVIKRGFPVQFEEAYGIPASFIWENRNFSMLLGIVDWKMNMKRLVPGGNASFDAGFQKIFKKIYPNLEIASDEALKIDQEIFSVYRALASIHSETEKGARDARRAGGH